MKMFKLKDWHFLCITGEPPMKISLKPFFFVSLFGSFLVGQGEAAPVETAYNGTTSGQPTWNRPIAGNPPTSLSGLGTAVSYTAQPFYAEQPGAYSFLSTANWDNYSFLYSGTFNSLSPLTNILTGNDDSPTIGLSGFSYNLTANSPYVLVITGFENKDSGTFRNTITGPGRIQFGSSARVPEAGSVLPIFGLVLAGLGVCNWKQKRAKSLPA
jgi:hypothetical protein